MFSLLLLYFNSPYLSPQNINPYLLLLSIENCSIINKQLCKMACHFTINDFCLEYMLIFYESVLIMVVQIFDYHMIRVKWQL